MKKIFLLLGLLMIVSCNPFDIDNVGKPIKFGLSGGKETRASYGYSDGYKQQISWDDGDNVSIYMKWDGNNGPENADYKIIDIRSNGHIESYGKLEPLGESLKWHGDFKDGRAYEYVHKFFSSYPPRQFDGEKFLYHIDSVQNGNNDIEDLYMAAYASTQNRVDYDSDATVYLEYYPMFTKLCVHIINNSDKDMKGDVLRLASSNHISGDYYVSVNGNKFAFDSFKENEGSNENAYTFVDKYIKGIAAHSESPELVYFIANNNYSDLYFVYNRKDYPIDAYIEGGNIYHITINVKDKTVDTKESRMTPTEAYMLFAILKNNGGGNNCWNDFEDFWKNVYKNGEYNFNDINDFNNSGFWDSFNSSIENTIFDDLGILLDEWFPGNLLDSLLATMSKIEDINLGEGTLASKMDMPDILSSSDFSDMFPNVKTIKLMPKTDITYKFVGLKHLESITLDGGFAVTVNIILENCASDVQINKGNNKTVTVTVT